MILAGCGPTLPHDRPAGPLRGRSALDPTGPSTPTQTVHVLHGMDVQIKRGEIAALLSPDGAREVPSSDPVLG